MLKNVVKKSVIAGSLVSLLALTACADKGTVSNSDNAGDNGNTSASGTTVTLSVMTSNRFLDLAKQKFEETHPDIKINIKESIASEPQSQKGGAMMMRGGGSPDPKNIEKYVGDVNTELMSGKASDIIVMDYLPFKKYADKNMLENISDLMSKDSSFNQADYYANVLDAMKYKDSLYTVPVNFSLNMLLGNKATLDNVKLDDTTWTWSDFVSLAKDVKSTSPEGYPLGYIDPTQLTSFMFNSSFNKFVDTDNKQAYFNTPEFTNLLEQAKSMYDDKLVPEEMTEDTNVTMFQSKPSIRDYMDMVIGTQSGFDGNSAYYHLPTESDTRGTSFTAGLPLAINSKSANKQAAWEFVKFLLSPEMQSARELSGFAVNKQAAAEQEEQLKTLGAEGGPKMMIRMNGKAVSPKPAQQEDIDRIEEAINSIKVCAESDPKITDIVTTESVPFFQGQKSAEDVAKVIQNKVSTYLQE